jgi:hypothetical protein
MGNKTILKGVWLEIFGFCFIFTDHSIAAFTSEKRWMTIKKSLFRHWPMPLILNFFIAYLSILVRFKTKGALGAVCALLHLWQLSV